MTAVRTPASAHVVHVRPRWSDMDVFGHVNHANLVTLLEEARVPLLFEGAKNEGLAEFAKGIVVARLSVEYHAPIVVSGQDVRVAMTLVELRHASFTLGYAVHDGPGADDRVAVTARTTLAPYSLDDARPRRLTEGERDFLRAQLPSGESP